MVGIQAVQDVNFGEDRGGKIGAGMEVTATIQTGDCVFGIGIL